jgi:hypothetical protein
MACPPVILPENLLLLALPGIHTSSATSQTRMSTRSEWLNRRLYETSIPLNKRSATDKRVVMFPKNLRKSLECQKFRLHRHNQ